MKLFSAALQENVAVKRNISTACFAVFHSWFKVINWIVCFKGSFYTEDFSKVFLKPVVCGSVTEIFLEWRCCPVAEPGLGTAGGMKKQNGHEWINKQKTSSNYKSPALKKMEDNNSKKTLTEKEMTLLGKTLSYVHKLYKQRDTTK